jgi:hypothetical protein
MSAPDISSLTDAHERLQAARDELQQQRELAPELGCPMIQDSVIKLLSNGLRTFCWLEKQGRSDVGAIRQLP